MNKIRAGLAIASAFVFTALILWLNVEVYRAMLCPEPVTDTVFVSLDTLTMNDVERLNISLVPINMPPCTGTGVREQ